MTADQPDAITTLIERVFECHIPVSQILDHMLRAPAGLGADDVVTTLRSLLHDVLEPLAARHTPRDLAAAAAVLADVCEQLHSEILLVPHVAPAGSSARRRQQMRNAC